MICLLLVCKACTKSFDLNFWVQGRIKVLGCEPTSCTVHEMTNSRIFATTLFFASSLDLANKEDLTIYQLWGIFKCVSNSFTQKNCWLISFDQFELSLPALIFISVCIKKNFNAFWTHTKQSAPILMEATH